MRSLFVAFSLLFAPLSFAQDYVWTTAATPSMRFPDAPTAGPTYPEKVRLEVILREGDRIRVRHTVGYGWIDAKAVVTTPPEGAEPTGGGLPAGLGGEIDMKMLEQLLQQNPGRPTVE